MQSVNASIPSGLRLCQPAPLSKVRRTTAAALKPGQDQKSDPKLVQAARTYSEGVAQAYAFEWRGVGELSCAVAIQH